MKRYKLRDLLTEESQREIQKSFAFATGFGVVFTDIYGSHIGCGDNFCEFCDKINETKEGARYCEQSNRNAINMSLKTQKPCIYICHAGLVNIEIPLIYSGEYVGALTAGQIICSEENDYPTDAAVAEVDWLSDPVLCKYYEKIERMTRQQIEATAQALSTITNFIVQTRAYAQAKEELAIQREQFLKEENRRIHLEKQLKLAQLDILQKQVMPHFIFNVINSISRMLTLEEYETAGEMLSSFSQMMRYGLSNMRSAVSLKEELDYIENYLWIQKIRFGERIQYEMICDPELEGMSIPFFSLQPLVENSINHGILNKKQGGKVSVCCTKGTDYTDFVICDNGVGIGEQKLSVIQECLIMDAPEKMGAHIGLYNCFKRLKLLFGAALDFRIESKEMEGTKISIHLSDRYVCENA